MATVVARVVDDVNLVSSNGVLDVLTLEEGTNDGVDEDEIGVDGEEEDRLITS